MLYRFVFYPFLWSRMDRQHFLTLGVIYGQQEFSSTKTNNYQLEVHENGIFLLSSSSLCVITCKNWSFCEITKFMTQLNKWNVIPCLITMSSCWTVGFMLYCLIVVLSVRQGLIQQKLMPNQQAIETLSRIELTSF